VEVLARGGNILYILINQRLKKFTCYKRRAKTAGRRRARRDIEAEPAPLSPSQLNASQSQTVVVPSPAAVVVSPAAAVVVSPAAAVVVSSLACGRVVVVFAAAAVVVSAAAAVVVFAAAAVVVSAAAAVVVSAAAAVVVSAAAAVVVSAAAAVVVSPAAAVVVSPAAAVVVSAAVVVVDAGQHTSWHVGPSKTLSIKEAALREATQATKSTSGIFIFLCGFEFFLLL